VAKAIELPEWLRCLRFVNNAGGDEPLIFEDHVQKVVFESEEITNHERFVGAGSCPTRDSVFRIRKFFD
jgi:hypothetical protein